MSELSGKCAVVTGASRGIGASTAEILAGQGVAVVLTARSTGQIEEIAARIRENGGKAEAVTCDVSRFDDVQKAVAACQNSFGGLDILVNNAGVIDPIGHLSTSNPEEWANATDINYKGVYFGLRAALPVMQAQGGGTIVNVSSGAAHGPMEGWSHYCSAKAAAYMLTRCADQEVSADGVRVVGLSPGTVATYMQTAIKASGVNPVSQLDPSVHIDPSWPARAIAWLCTDDAAEFAGQDVSLREDDIRRRIGLI
ncbi:MAG: SDR family oxidoreductase [Alphaproteobacteria bacterium]|nr:SDR family oxidoreductase [Alphaproteobacteria bacterium]